MPLTSDISIAAPKFRPGAISEKTAKLNEYIIDIGESGPKWWEVGPSKYRQMRLNGETPLPKPTILPQGKDFSIPSRDPGREISCRILHPSSVGVDGKAKGIIMHFHGGGWVLMSDKTSDPLLQFYAETSGCVAISVGYRLAPEHPFPAGPEDCYDAAEYFIKNGEKEYGGPLRFIGGESAGAHLSVLTTYHALRTFPEFSLSGGLLLHFGSYDLTLLPQSYTLRKAPLLTRDITKHFFQAFLPDTTVEERKSPAISPLYEDLEQYRQESGSRLPNALFTCGTADPLLDDSVFMATKWLMAGGAAILKIYEGAAHGFLGFQPDVSEATGLAMSDTKMFIEERVEAAYEWIH